jgi:glycosyltransferase involved in cell wall biosynthesis
VAVGVLQNKIIIKLSETLEKFLYRRAACVVVNSPGYINHVNQRGAKRTELIPNGADLEMFKKSVETDLFDELMFKNKFIVLYAGAHGLSNDLFVVLDAANQLRQNEMIHFVFVGDGKEKTNLMDYATKLQLENVTWIGSIPKEKIGSILRSADLGLAILKPIELYKTTYPNKVFDYMAAGLPVLLAIDGVIRDVVENANAGVFVQPGNVSDLVNKIKYLYDHNEILSEYSKNGQNYIQENFNREKLSKSLLKIMEEL